MHLHHRTRATLHALRTHLPLVVVGTCIATTSAFGAAAISGRNIINGTVTSADIRNGSLQVADLSAKSRRTLRGANGANGAAGAPGLAGLAGPMGPMGPLGPTGEGWSGTTPASAVPGPEGPVGAKGDKGDTGDPGDTGAPGARGPEGAPGQQGEHGKDGAPGQQGEHGTDGAPGLQGKDGPPGLQGAPGLQGKDGPPGLQGAPGQQGEKGDRGPAWTPSQYVVTGPDVSTGNGSNPAASASAACLDEDGENDDLLVSGGFERRDSLANGALVVGSLPSVNASTKAWSVAFQRTGGSAANVTYRAFAVCMRE